MFYGNGNDQYGANGNVLGGSMGNPGFTNPVQPNQAKIMNVLTQDEIQRLMTQKNQFSLMITEEDKLRAYCNHRLANGLGDALVEDEDGRCRCEICGYTFTPADITTTKEEVQQAANYLVDFLQTIKMIYVDLDSSVIRDFFPIIPLINKIPELFDMAVKNYAKHEKLNPLNGLNGRNMSTAQMFAALTGMLNGNTGFQPNYQQSQQYYNTGFGYQNPYQQPVYGQPNIGPSNGFGYAGASTYNPQTAGFQYVPNQTVPTQPQAAPAPAPTAPSTPDAPVAAPVDANVTGAFKAGN